MQLIFYHKNDFKTKSKFYAKIKNKNFWGLDVEENFDIDKHIDKIKSQLEETAGAQNPDLGNVPQDILDGVPSNEPSLGEYVEQDENLPSQEAHPSSDTSEQVAEPVEQDYSATDDNDWQDPFGTNEDDAVKKYVMYIAKDFVPLIDDMDKDARSAFVNEALQLKVNMEGKDRKWHAFTRILRHIIVSVFTLLVAVPALFWLADKSITATVQNYEYVQKNFEKLYKDKADRDKAAREIQQMRLGL